MNLGYSYEYDTGFFHGYIRALEDLTDMNIMDLIHGEPYWSLGVKK